MKSPWRRLLFFLPVFWALLPMAGAEDGFARLPDKAHFAPDAPPGNLARFGDLNGDKAPDLLLAGYDSSSLFLNDGHGRFAFFSKLIGAEGGDLGDVDGDGDLDIFLVHPQGYMRLLLNDGKAAFADATATNLPPASYYQCGRAALRDLDGDGDLDAVGISADVKKAFLWLNDGTGIFTDASAARLPIAEFGGSLQVADLDGDLDLDILAIRSEGSKLLVNDGKARFADASAQLPITGGLSTRSACLGDVDRDGDLDIYIVGSSAPDRLWVNDGKGTFADRTASALPAMPGRTIDAAMGDLDGDGAAEVVLSLSDEGARLLENDGKGGFAFVEGYLATTPGLSTLAMADVEADGDLDLILLPSGKAPLLLVNLGDARFLAGTRPYLPGIASGTCRGVAIGDVDGDGDRDILVAMVNLQNRLMLNDGNGLFQDATAAKMPKTYDKNEVLTLLDVDGDGDLDLFCSPSYGYARLAVNDGQGTFADATAGRVPQTFLYAASAAAGDVDGDGDPDVVVGNDQSRLNTLFLNDGRGVFTDATPSRLPLHADSTREVLLGDFDRDGDLDLFVVNYNAYCRFYRNDGKGAFTDQPQAFPIPLYYPLACGAAGDFDHDGDLDVAIGGGGSCPGGALINDNGAFSPSRGGCFPGLASSFTDLVLLDHNGDGHLDIVMGSDGFTSAGNNPLLLMIGLGNGEFANDQGRHLPLLGRKTTAVRAADLDGDGDEDLVLSPEPEVWPALRRQANAPRIPARGATWRVDMYGARDQSFLPLLGFAPGRLDLAPLGVFRLDLQAFVALPVVSLPPRSDVASLPLPIPAEAALREGRFFFQALVLDPLRPERTRFTSLVSETIQ